MALSPSLPAIPATSVTTAVNDPGTGTAHIRIWALPADQHRAEAGGLRNYEYNPVWGSWSIRAGSDGPNRRAAVTVTYLPAALGWFILAWMRRREYV